MFMVLEIRILTLGETQKSTMDNPEKHKVHKTKNNKAKTQRNIGWTPSYANIHKQPKQDMSPPTNSVHNSYFNRIKFSKRPYQCIDEKQ